MKICVINNIFYPYSRGGADKISRVIVDNLIKEGDDVFVITTKPERIKVDSGKYSVYYLYSKFQNLSSIPLFFRVFWHFFDNFNFINYFKIRNILKREKPDLVISNNLKGIGFLTPICVKKQRIKHVHILHDIQLLHPSGLMLYGEEEKINTLMARLYAEINAWLFDLIDVVVSPSDWLLSLHQKKKFFSKNKVLVIPNPVEIKTTEQIDKAKKNNIFVCVGEIEKHKGVLFLLEAFKKLHRRKGRDYKIIFIGEGKEDNKLNEAAQNNSFVEYLGKLENKKVIECIAQSKALIMPSLCYENSPTVIYEAYNENTPVIASRIGGITELVRKYGGILFRPNDESDFIKKIDYFISQSDNLDAFTKNNDFSNLDGSSYVKRVKSL